MVRRLGSGVNRADACKAIDDYSLRIRVALTPGDSFGRWGRKIGEVRAQVHRRAARAIPP
jgi:hypothetical protein